MLQVAPMLNFLLSSGCKKKEPRYVCLSEAKASLRRKTWVTTGFKKVLRYTIHFSQKFQQTNPLPGSPKGPYREGGPPTGNFAYPSKKKTSSFRFTSERRPPWGPPYGVSYESNAPSQSTFMQLSKFPVDEPSSRFLKSGAPIKRCPSQEPQWSRERVTMSPYTFEVRHPRCVIQIS